MQKNFSGLSGLGREYITLIGRNPYNEISGRLLKNRILIKGEFQDDIGRFYNRKIFKVTEWDIIFPVTREYSLSDYKKSRLVGPIFYIDQFDIETGDIFEYKNATKSISNLEAEYMAYTNNTCYFIVTPQIKEDAIVWHSINCTFSENVGLEKTISKETIQLEGDELPESILNQNVLFNGSFQKYINKFLLCGYKQGNTIYVKTWQIITPFENKITGGGKNFLDKDDFIN